MQNKREFRFISSEVRMVNEEGQPKKLVGMIPYNQRSLDLGGFTEVIAPGAFTSSLNGDILALRDHDPKLLLGRTKSGTLTFSDEADGLHYTITLPNTTAGNDLAESASRGDLDQTSFGFYCNSDEWSEYNTLRTLKDVDLFEVSPCSFACYPASSVQLRSLFPDGNIEVPKPVEAEPKAKDTTETDENRNLQLRIEIAQRF